MPDILIRDAAPADDHVLADFNLQLAFESESITLEPTVVLSGVRNVLADPAKGRYFVAVVAGDAAPARSAARPASFINLVDDDADDWCAV